MFFPAPPSFSSLSFVQGVSRLFDGSSSSLASRFLGARRAGTVRPFCSGSDEGMPAAGAFLAQLRCVRASWNGALGFHRTLALRNTLNELKNSLRDGSEAAGSALTARAFHDARFRREDLRALRKLRLRCQKSGVGSESRAQPATVLRHHDFQALAMLACMDVAIYQVACAQGDDRRTEGSRYASIREQLNQPDNDARLTYGRTGEGKSVLNYQQALFDWMEGKRADFPAL
ncbi:hypothetical protein [Paludibacterium paludis]|uniref:hypothetical protein n=1 Tax=Paludibacterium paludis TaxID=1225769 RepID=UPI0016776E72|nr:hypothetical protein [Paludibacterium paludis]